MTIRRAPAVLLALLVAACTGEPDKQEPAAASPAPAASAPSAPAPAPVPSAPTAPAADAGPPRPAGISDEQVEAADAVQAWFKTLAAAARGSATDCVAMARAIESVGAKGRPIVARAKEMQKKVQDPAAAAWLADYLKARMETGFNEMVSAMGPCAENPTVKKAMKAIAK